MEAVGGVASIDDELELELIQPHMAQKPVLRGEVGCACVAREVSVEKGGMGDDVDVAAGVNYVERALGGGHGALLRRRPWGAV